MNKEINTPLDTDSKSATMTTNINDSIVFRGFSHVPSVTIDGLKKGIIMWLSWSTKKVAITIEDNSLVVSLEPREDIHSIDFGWNQPDLIEGSGLYEYDPDDGKGTE